MNLGEGRVNLDTGQICGWGSNDRPWFEIVQYKWCQKSCNNFFCFLWIYYSVRQKVLFATSPRFHPTNSTNSSKKSSWWNDCSTKWIWEFTPQAVLIHLKKAPDGMIVPAPEIENIQVRCLFCTRDRPPGRQISRNDDDLYPTCHCICTEDRGEFYQLVEKIWTRGRRRPNFF